MGPWSIEGGGYEEQRQERWKEKSTEDKPLKLFKTKRPTGLPWSRFRFHAPTLWATVQLLVKKLRSYMPRSVVKQNKTTVTQRKTHTQETKAGKNVEEKTKKKKVIFSPFGAWSLRMNPSKSLNILFTPFLLDFPRHPTSNLLTFLRSLLWYGNPITGSYLWLHWK